MKPTEQFKGNQKKFPTDNFTRNTWNLLCSRMRYGIITTLIIEKDGTVHTYESRRQARLARRQYPQSVMRKA